MFLLFLVVAQFGLAAALVLTADWTPFPWVAAVVGTPGALLAVSAWRTMGLRKIRIHPSSTDKTKLLVTGPYRIVRHPMYSGLLWFSAALLLAGFEWWRFASWIALVLVLIIKAKHEEISISNRFTQYSAYQQQVGQFLPKWGR